MLAHLHVKNLALIEEIEVEFGPGLNILTGETGAGKSILLGSMQLILGAKTSKNMIRENASYALVELLFQVENEKALETLKALDICPEDGQVLLSRKIMDGRSINKINGETSTVGQMKAAAACLLDIHGQHEHQSLLYQDKQLAILDAYGKEKILPAKEKVSLQKLKNKKRKTEVFQMKRKVLAGLLSAAMVATTVFGSVGVWAAEETAEDASDDAAADEDSDTAKINPEGKKYKIALSNSYMGNDWRQQMEAIAEYVASQEPYASRCELTIVNSENDAESQSASIDAMAAQGYDCILVDPASETGVNQAIQRACDAGIKVVVFDQPASVSNDNCWHIRIDGGRSYKILAKWMAEAIGGEGNVVLDQGLQGAAEAELEYSASKEMFETYDKINIVSDYVDDYDPAKGEQALASIIAANPDIDAVTTQGYVSAVVNAFSKAGLDIPVSCGGGYNGNLKTLKANNAEGIIDVYIAGLSAVALNYAIRIMDGEEMDEETVIDCAFIATSNGYDMGEYSDVPIELAEEGVNYFEDQPDELIWPAVPSTFGLDIPMSVITGEE